jgi:hypothetical protein
MRVGFIRGLLWERYGDFWVSLLRGLELEPQFADPAHVHQLMKGVTVPGTSFQVAIAEAFALSGMDLIIAPHLNPQPPEASKTINRGSGQDPWTASFPQALQTLSGLPSVVGVPARLESSLETLAIELLLSIKHDPAKVRLVWERHKRKAQPKRFSEPQWRKQPGQREVVAVTGQPWLFVTPLLEKLNNPKVHFIFQHQLDPSLLREEAKRLEKRLIDTDAEVLGGSRYFNRKGDIDKLIMLVDKSSGADHWLEQQAKKIVTKPLEVVYLQDLVSESEMVEALLKAHS